MNAQEIVLDIAVNLGRLSRWASEGNSERVEQFIAETDSFTKQLEKVSFKKQFESTFLGFKKSLNELKRRPIDINWAEDALTWANILTHRAKLA